MTKIRPLTNEELTALAAKIQAEYGSDFRPSPFGLLEALSAHVLAHHIPEHAELFRSRERSDIERDFAVELLGLHGYPETPWLQEEEQERFYGDKVLTLFDKLDDELLARYAERAAQHRSAAQMLADQDSEG
jgi:hypothetical protein